MVKKNFGSAEKAEQIVKSVLEAADRKTDFLIDAVTGYPTALEVQVTVTYL